MSQADATPAVPEPKLRWYQYSLRTRLLALPVVAWCLVTGIHGCIFAAVIVGTIVLVIKHKWGLALSVLAAFLFASFLGLGDAVEVRLHTGDQRYLFWGVPLGKHRALRPELREALLSLDDREVPKQWVWCATQVGSNNAHIMVFDFYRCAVAWVEVDPEIARLVVRDIATYVHTTHATKGLPECTAMLWPDVVSTDSGRPSVIAGWRKNPEVQRYLAKKGYVGHPTPPAR